MAIITNTVRWADNTAELKANLLQGIGTIDAMKSSVDRTAASLGGQGLFLQANKVTAAIDQLGGVTKLTAAEQDRANTLLEKAIEKYQLMGVTAPPAMVALAEATKQNANNWQDFVDKFDVKGAVSDPLGTAKEAMGAFAESVGPAAVATVGVASAMVVLEKEAFDLTMQAAKVGEGIYDASLKMSASVPAVSQLKFAAEAAGGSLDQVASLAFVMQQRMAQNPTQFTEGLKALNVSASEFAGLAVDQRVLAISTAMRTAGVDTNLQAASMELFGRQGRDGLALLMKPLDDLIQQGKELGFTWTETDAKAADELAIKTRVLGAEWDKLKTDVGAQLIPTLTFLEQHLGTIVDLAAKLAGVPLPTLKLIFHALGVEVDYGRAALDTFMGTAADVPKVTGDAGKGVAAWKDETKDLALHIPTVNDALLAEKEVSRDLDGYLKELNKSLTDMQSAGDGWKGTLDTIDGSVVEAIKYYLQAGVSQSALATAYGLTAAQVKSVATELAGETAAQKIATEGATLAEKAWTEYYTNAANLYASDTQKAANAAEQKYELAVAEAQKKGIVDVNYYNALWALRDQDVNKAGVDSAALVSHSVEGLQAIYDKAQATFTAMMSDGLHHSQAQQEYFRNLRDVALDALHGISDGAAKTEPAFDAMNDKVMGLKTSFDGWNTAIMGVNQSLEQTAVAADKAAAAAQKAADAAQKMRDMGSSMTYDLSTDEGIDYFQSMNPGATISWSKSQVEAFIQKGGSLQQLEQMGVIDVYAGLKNDPNIPHFASGVNNFGGGWAMVGEHGPEMINLPRGSSVTPNGRLAGATQGGQTISVTNHFSGVLATDMSQIDSLVSSSIMRTARSVRRLGSA